MSISALNTGTVKISPSTSFKKRPKKPEAAPVIGPVKKVCKATLLKSNSFLGDESGSNTISTTSCVTEDDNELKNPVVIPTPAAPDNKVAPPAERGNRTDKTAAPTAPPTAPASV